MKHLTFPQFVYRLVVAGKSVRLALPLIVLLSFRAHLSLAQNLPFPQPDPTTAADSLAQLSSRVTEVIETNACGREDDFLAIRNAMQGGDYGDEGENLSHILVAKIAFIRSHARTSSTSCIKHITRLRKDFDEHLRLVAAVGPAACATEHYDDLAQHPGADEAIDVTVSTSLLCMSTQLNDSVKAMKKTTQLGSSGVPCLSRASLSSNGEFDVNVRELARILYLSGSIGQRDGTMLDPSTIDYMYDNLLAARGKLSDSSYPVVIGCDEPAGDELGSPEDTADRDSWFNDLTNFLGHLFEWLVLTYLTYGLLPGGGALIVAPYVLAAAGGDLSHIPLAHAEIYVPETENHRLMIETSKYLTNADIIARLESEDYDGVDKVKEDQAGVRSWLLGRLQDITARDFQEYNARPYSRYSLNAILNLNDFAAVHSDPEVALAAGIVLDLSAAKFAATSNRGRRVVPFRRLSNVDATDDRNIYEAINGADHEVVRSMLLTGQVGLLDKTLTNAPAVMAEMVNAATSSYHLPAPVLSTAIERKPFAQTVLHTSVELVEQSPAFTISAGGIRSGPTNTTLGIGRDEDKGVATPTVLIPTITGTYIRDLFRFLGGDTSFHRADNTCVAPGFACGIDPKLSDAFGSCTKRASSESPSIAFISSAECFSNVTGPHFYLAVLTASCSGCSVPWGIFDAVEASPPPAGTLDLAYQAFQAQRTAAFEAVTLDSARRGTYVTAAGQTIQFGIAELGTSGMFNIGSKILSVDGNPPPAWRTTGGAIEADGIGNATLKGGTGIPELIAFPPANFLGPYQPPSRTP